MRWNDYAGALLDLDGVLTPTAEVHMRAWAQLFTGVLEQHDGSGDTSAYTDADYFAHIDGKPRQDGVADFLTARGIELTDQQIRALGDRKNDAFTAVLHQEGLEAYAGSIRLVEHLEARGVAIAVVSSSRNALDVLDTAGLSDRFPVVVHGGVAAERGLAGKPHPDTYLYAARQLGVPSASCVVVEDAVSGVQAGAAGDFGLVVGVDRGVGASVLLRHGADVVVTDLAELIED